MEAKLKRRVEQEGSTRAQILREKKSRLSKLAGLTTLALLGMINQMESLVSAFMAQNSTNRSKLVKSYCGRRRNDRYDSTGLLTVT